MRHTKKTIITILLAALILSLCGSATYAVLRESASYGTQNTFSSRMSLSDARISSEEIPSVVYDGTAHEPEEVKLTCAEGESSAELVPGTDYNITGYGANTNAGKGYVYLEGIGNYYGQRTLEFEITKRPIEFKVLDQSIRYMDELPSYGEEILNVIGGDSNSGFVPGEDYSDFSGTLTFTCMNSDKTKEYASGDPVGEYTLSVSGLSSDNYDIRYTDGTLTVLPMQYTRITIDEISDVEYTGTAQTPELSLHYGSLYLVSGRDYTVDYSKTDNINVGTVSPVVTLCGNLIGSLYPQFDIVPAMLEVTADDLSITYGDAAPEYTYTITGFKNSETVSSAGVTGTPVLSCDYIAMDDAGSYDITITDGSGGNALNASNYEFTLIEGALTVNKKNLSGMTMAPVEDQEYTGSEIKPMPAVTGTNSSGAAMTVPAAELSYTYSNNVEVGTNATVTASAKPTSKNYTGSLSETFNIVPAGEPIIVICEDGMATVMVDKPEKYSVGTEFTDALGKTTVKEVLELPASIVLGDDLSCNSPLFGNDFITSVNFDETAKRYHPTSLDALFLGCANLETVTHAEYLDTSKVESMFFMFGMCSNLESVDVSSWDTANVTDMMYMFYGCSKLKSLDVSGWKTGNVTMMNSMFNGCEAIETIKGTENWDLSSATNIGYMFADCRSLTELDVSTWETGNIPDMWGVFAECYKLKSIDVSNWDVGKATNLQQMFVYCFELESLDLSNWDVSSNTSFWTSFEGCTNLKTVDVGDWNVSNVTTIESMFESCAALENLNVSNWDTSKITTAQAAFCGCAALESLDVSKWNTSSLEDTSYMFWHCEALTELDVSSWDVHKVTDAHWMFANCSNLTTIYGEDWTSVLDVDFYPTGSSMVVPYADSEQMFREDTKLVGAIAYDDAKRNGLYANPTTGYFVSHRKPMIVIGENGNAEILFDDERKYTTGKTYTDNLGETVVKEAFVLPADMSAEPSPIKDNTFITGVHFAESASEYVPVNLQEFFCGCGSIETITGLSNLNTENVTDMSGMFKGCASVTEIEDIDELNVSAVESLSEMFSGCSSMTSVDVSEWDIANVTDMSGMFKDCSEISDFSSLEGKNVEAVENMSEMFSGSGITEADFSAWNTSAVTDISGMFADCDALISLELKDWDVSNVEDISRLFYDSDSILELDLSGWKVGSVEDAHQAFAGCDKLTTIHAGNWTKAMKAETDSESGTNTGTADMFAGSTKLVGAIGYDATKVNGEYANSRVGYFVSDGEALIVVGENKNATFLYGNKAEYPKGDTYTDNLGETKVYNVYSFSE